MFGSKRARLAVIVAGGAALVLAISSAAVAAGSANVVAPNAHVNGLTNGQWSAEQWTWELTAPNDPTHQVVDPNPGTAAQPEPVDCSLGQHGNVWFLAGTTYAQHFSTAYRSCNVPAGKFLYFPLIDVWGDNLSCPGTPNTTLTAEQLQSILAEQTDNIVPGSLHASVDGQAVANLHDASTPFRAQASGFSYTLPADNALGPNLCKGVSFPAGTMPPPPGAFADGVYVMLPPLAVGTHHIDFGGAESGGPIGSFGQEIHYTITVTSR
jgi:hypothetical protein